MATEKVIERPYQFNRAFKILRGHSYIDLGKGELLFPNKVNTEQWRLNTDRRYCFGWNFAHSGVILSDCNLNFERALRRILSLRFPHEDGKDTEYRTNQVRFVNLYKDTIISAFKIFVGSIDWDTDFLAYAHNLTLQPHAKRLLREQGLTETLLGKRVGINLLERWCSSVLWKPKRNEYAKPGKYQRMIADYGVSASLQTVPYCNIAKSKFANVWIDLDNISCKFVATPDPWLIREVIIEMQTKTRAYIFFSDDGLYWDGCQFYNIDFSSADASVSGALFALFYDAFNFPDDVRKLFEDQILAPIRIEDRNKETRLSILLKPLRHYLGSGIGCTTLVHCVGQVCFALSLGRVQSNTIESIEVAGRAMGYKLDIEKCEEFEDIQFLKMSPVKIGGTFIMIPNLGVILRASGCYKKEIPGKGDFSKRAAAVQTALMDGLLSGFSHEHFDRLNPKVYIKGMKIDIDDVALLKHGYHSDLRIKLPLESVYIRYRFDANDFAEMDEIMRNISYGLTAHGQCIAKIMERDYGLGLKPL